MSDLPDENAGPHPGSILLRAYSDFTRDPSDQHFAAMMFAAVEYRNYKRNKQAKAVAEHTVGPVSPPGMVVNWNPCSECGIVDGQHRDECSKQKKAKQKKEKS